MSGNKAILVDTNALIYFFNGNQKVVDAIEDEIIYVSAITEIELLSFPKLDIESELGIRMFLNDENCRLVELISAVKELTIKIRKKHKIKLPDAIVAATAIFLGIPLLTFDTDFSKIEELDLILLEV
jgi:predicted nucleic acid-binding protein